MICILYESVFVRRGLLYMIYLEIYKNYSHKINIINFMECFTKILSIIFKGAFLKKLFLWNEPLRKIGFVKKVFWTEKYISNQSELTKNNHACFATFVSSASQNHSPKLRNTFFHEGFVFIIFVNSFYCIRNPYFSF